MSAYILIPLLVGVALISWVLGRWYESRKRVITMESLTFLQAVKWLLLHERHRHHLDIYSINEDLAKLSKVPLPENTAELDCWIEIK